MRFGLVTRAPLAFQSAFQPPATWYRAAILPRVSPRCTVTLAPLAVFVTVGLLAYVFFLTTFFVVTGLRTVDRETGAVVAPPLARVRPARCEHTGQAPGPCEASTRCAMAICSA